jgi:hypothetical protein
MQSKVGTEHPVMQLRAVTQRLATSTTADERASSGVAPLGDNGARRR